MARRTRIQITQIRKMKLTQRDANIIRNIYYGSRYYLGIDIKNIKPVRDDEVPSISDIAKWFNVSKSTIQDILDNKRLPELTTRRKKGAHFSQEDKDDVILDSTRMTRKQLQEKYNCSYTTIWNILNSAYARRAVEARQRRQRVMRETLRERKAG